MEQNNQNSMVLIVDDTPKNIQVIGSILMEQKYRISVAKNGREALKVVKDVKPDIILLDVIMPELDGFETCKQLKESPETRDIPIIFLTAKIETEDIVKAFELGAVDYVIKPFNAKELLVRVNTHLDLKRTQDQLIQSEKMASLGGLVAGVAHEINTPVGIGITAVSSLLVLEDIKKMAELYKKDQISRGDFKEFLQTTNNSGKLIQKNLERTASLVQSFKQVSVDQSTEQKREFYLKPYLEDVIRSLYPKFKQRDVDINIDCDEKLQLNSYPGTFAQIFTNLILNSIAHGFKKEKRKGVIDILVKQEDKQIQIEYKDNGEGIPGEI
jgi:DNA-binding response OmpR family regulator